MPRRPTTLAVRALVAAACLLVAGPIVRAAHGAGFPLKAGPGGRYLVDAAGAPFLVTGDSPQSLVVNLTEAQADSFFADRAAHGFNAVWIDAVCTTYTGGRADASMLDGTLPFTAKLSGNAYYDLTVPNETYFAHLDRVLALAANRGLLVLLDPIETAGWMNTLVANGSTRCRTFGAWLGTRYAAQPNLVWMHGNDFQDWTTAAHDTVARAVAIGIEQHDANHPQTVELNYYVSSSLDDPAWTTLLGFNSTYTYYPTYAQLRADWNRAGFLPNVMIESNYEFESNTGPLTTTAVLRKQEYWTMTSGAAGQLYGNGWTWPFKTGWQAYLDSPGATQVGYLRAFFASRPWYTLVPDTTHVVLVAGYGTESASGTVAANNAVTAARSANGRLVVAYTPVLTTFTVALSQLAGPATARWFDPSAGTYTAIPGSPFANSGTHAFTPPGANADGDGGWVLVLETNPPEADHPTVHLTNPGAGATLAGLVPLAATATDSLGVTGVRFLVDGVAVGAESWANPDTATWNTRAASNGTHLVKVVARNLAGTPAADSVLVTVNNSGTPPPTDHLVAAYAFDQASGTQVADASGNGNTLALHGAGFVVGHAGNALGFDGATSWAEAANSTSLDIAGTGLTLAFWVKVDTAGAGTTYAVLDKPWNAASMASPFYQYGVEYANRGTRTLNFSYGDAGGALHGPYGMTPTPGQWTHVAFTYDGYGVNGYLNGVLAVSAPASGSIAARGQTLRLGVDAAHVGFLDGGLDDVRIYSRALTPTEVHNCMVTPVGTYAAPGDTGPPGRTARVQLAASRPNPFRGHTDVGYTLPEPLVVDLAVFDVAGRRACTLDAGPRAAGPHTLAWDGHDARGALLPAGRYVLRLAAGGESHAVGIVLLR